MKETIYDEQKIRVLEDIEGVRKRPSMYIGDVGIRGLHQCVFELIDNAIDESLAGFCKRIRVTIEDKNTIVVEDDGRGIPVGIHPEYNLPTLELILTKLHSGGKFDNSVYKISGGLHGVGLSVVNALAKELDVWVKRDGAIYHQKYKYGKPVTPLKIKGNTKETGTKIRFVPDDEIFEVCEFDWELIEDRLRQLAYLLAGVEFILVDKIKDKKQIYKYTGGIAEFVKALNKDREVLHKVIFIEKQKDAVKIQVAFQYTDTFIETSYSFANTIHTKDGGTHLTGFRAGLTRVINEFGKRLNLLKESLSAEDIREGLTSVVCVYLPSPQFEGQTKTRLANSSLKNLVEYTVYQELSKVFEKEKSIAKKIIEKALLTKKAKEAAKRAKELVKKRSTLFETLSGKLADCSERVELFIVEGESAGGSAKQARDRKTQAILALRGKILNVEKAKLEKILDNEETKAIISAIGGGIGPDGFDIKKVRYMRIIIMTDADVDGAHIKTLLLTLFYRYLKPVIEAGLLYIARPPLYRVKTKKKEIYLYSDEELKKVLSELNEDGVVIQRYKGLGEMNPIQLWETTMNPKKRILSQVTIKDAIIADRIFSILLGENVEERRRFIFEHANLAQNLDI